MIYEWKWDNWSRVNKKERRVVRGRKEDDENSSTYRFNIIWIQLRFWSYRILFEEVVEHGYVEVQCFPLKRTQRMQFIIVGFNIELEFLNFFQKSSPTLHMEWEQTWNSMQRHLFFSLPPSPLTLESISSRIVLQLWDLVDIRLYHDHIKNSWSQLKLAMRCPYTNIRLSSRKYALMIVKIRGLKEFAAIMRCGKFSIAHNKTLLH